MEVATMRIRVLSVVCLFWILVQPAAAEVPGSHEVIVRRLHPKAIVVGSGGTYGDTMLALASERGLVVVDTGTTTTLTRSYRKKIEEVFGRADFAFVVNTHYHYDHTVGNPVFPEATVVGHELTRSRLYDWYNDLDTFVARQRGRVVGWRSAAENLDLESRFGYLTELGIDPGELTEQHEAGVETVWMVAKGGSDATVAINEALDEGGDIDRAITAYRRSLELDPENSNGAAQLKQLEGLKQGE